MAEPVWDIVRRESSYLRKFNGIELSAEPSNLLAKNSFKYSGLAQTGSLGVTVQTVKGQGRQEQGARDEVRPGRESA